MLSPHFKLSEFERSQTAAAHGIANRAPVSAVSNLQNLCQEVLEPLRLWLGEPVIVNSGYRCRELNSLVGGVKNSQHMAGEAADLRVRSEYEAHLWQRWIDRNCEYDQCIVEHNSQGAFWLHVSCKRDLRRNRHRCFDLKK